MSVLVSRRGALLVAGSALAVSAFPRSGFATPEIEAWLTTIEKKTGGRLGVAIRDTESDTLATHRPDERFPLCSTFKFLAAALVLARVDRGQERLDRRVVFTQRDVVTYSPVTEKHVGGDGISMADICEAAVTLSDNTAGNLMFASFGGPAGLTTFLRGLGDPVSRLDRIETELNEARPGDPRDTTTPAAMLGNMKKLLVGDALSQASREQLTRWLVASKTGDARLRAGFPADWRAGDKTGSGNNGATNDVAIIWPPGRKPLLIAAYLVETKAASEARNAALAEVGRAAARMVS